MFFKNLQVYRLKSDWKITPGQLEEQLARAMFAHCASHQATSKGWTSPRKDGALAYTQNRQWLIALTIEQRLLPASVINDEVSARADKLTDEQGHAPGRKQLRELKERVTEELMPRAFTKRRNTFAWIDRDNGWLAIDGSASQAAELIELLRHSLDDFPLLPLHSTISPTSAMADWLAGGEAPAGFTIDRDCELQSAGEDKSAVSYKRCPIETERVRADLASGKLPTKLALTWDDRISFVLTENLDIKRLAFLDLLKEQAEKNAEQGMPSPEQEPDNSTRFANMIGAKYIHPQNRELTWSGRGRQPKWVEFWITNGGTLDQLTAQPN